MTAQMKVLLVDSTPDCEHLIAKAAKLCYSASRVEDLIDRIDKQNQEKFIKKIVSIGHHSVLEHMKFSYVVEGVSRVLSHQLVRHRIASFSQQSQRYVTLDKTFDYITPLSIERHEAAYQEYTRLMEVIHKIYMAMVDSGIPAEDARYVLPNATETKVFITMNARELLHFFKVRCCNRAQWEIRNMAIEMLRQAKQVAPLVFDRKGPGCIQGPCGEGNMACGKMEEVREKFLALGRENMTRDSASFSTEKVSREEF
jgi:thymidylate synthase (FAD)